VTVRQDAMLIGYLPAAAVVERILEQLLGWRAAEGGGFALWWERAA